jgi:hypothetical protein
MTNSDQTATLPARSNSDWEQFKAETVAINRAARRGDWVLMQTLIERRSNRHRALLNHPPPASESARQRELIDLEHASMAIVARARSQIGQELLDLQSSRSAASSYDRVSKSASNSQ